MQANRIRKIPVYNDINLSHEAMGYSGRTDLPSFHIFTLEDTYPSTRQIMTPYINNFYQVMLIEESQDAVIELNTAQFSNNSAALVFGAPGLVSAWVRGEAQKGFIVYFKEDFLSQPFRELNEEFPFFSPSEAHFLALSGLEQAAIQAYFNQLLDAFQGNQPYRIQILQSLLLAVLFECKGLFEIYRASVQHLDSRATLALRFQNLLNQYYLTHHTVQEYARLLNITPNHLSAAVSSTLGKTAHAMISNRIVVEARKLLTYTDLSVAEVADYLGFAEPTHFSRFFKKHTGSTPLAFRLVGVA